MGMQLPKPDHVPVNKVRALDLARELELEYSKRAWRDAVAQAKLRWLLEGGKIEKCAPGKTGRRQRGGWIE